MPDSETAERLTELGALGVLTLMILCLCSVALILGWKLGPGVFQCVSETNKSLVKAAESNVEVSRVYSDAMTQLAEKIHELDRNSERRHEQLKTHIKLMKGTS